MSDPAADKPQTKPQTKPKREPKPKPDQKPKPQTKPQREDPKPKSKPKPKDEAAQRSDLTVASSKGDFADWFEELMLTAGVVGKNWDVKGMPVFLPYGYSMHNSIIKLFEDEYAKLGIRQCQFPAFIPRSFLEREADHVKGFQAECFWYKDEMCLRPTSETAMYSMFHRWVRSEDDLPLMVHQSCTVWRYETKNTRPLIRVREIPWNEAHTAHSTPGEALELLEDCWGVVHRVLTERLSIDGLRLRRPDWDRFPGAEHTDVLDVVMPCGRVLQTIGAHYLGQHFSKVFDIAVNGENAYMTCIGVSTRALAAVLSMHGDDKGLIVPAEIAPIQVIVVPIINKASEQAVTERVAEIVAELRSAGLRARADLSPQKRPGDKYYYYDMMGVPLRIEFGPNDMKKGVCVLAVRGLEGKREVPLDNVATVCVAAMAEYAAALRERAQAHLQSRIVDCTELADLKGILAAGGFARIPYHTMAKEGGKGAEEIHTLCGGEIRGFRPEEPTPPEGTKCLVTGDPAKFWAYIARAY
jgi:prolyl-tRNA synthetase